MTIISKKQKAKLDAVAWLKVAGVKGPHSPPTPKPQKFVIESHQALLESVLADWTKKKTADAWSKKKNASPKSGAPTKTTQHGSCACIAPPCDCTLAMKAIGGQGPMWGTLNDWAALDFVFGEDATLTGVGKATLTGAELLAGVPVTGEGGAPLAPGRASSSSSKWLVPAIAIGALFFLLK